MSQENYMAGTNQGFLPTTMLQLDSAIDYLKGKLVEIRGSLNSRRGGAEDYVKQLRDRENRLLESIAHSIAPGYQPGDWHDFFRLTFRQLKTSGIIEKINLLTGSSLRSDFLNEYRNAMNNGQINEQFNNFLRENRGTIQRFMLDQVKNGHANVASIQHGFAQAIAATLQEKVNQTSQSYRFSNFNIGVTASISSRLTKSFQTVNMSFNDFLKEPDQIELPQVDWNLLSPIAQNAFRTIMSESGNNLNTTIRVSDVSDIGRNMHNIKNDTSFHWYDYTLGFTSTAVRSYARSLNPEDSVNFNAQINGMRQEFVEKLYQFITAKVGDIPFLMDVLRTVIVKEQANIFVGQNVNAITGLLGEIRALLILRNMFPTAYNVEWTAQRTFAGEQLHADIIINNIFGIQVKNTTYDGILKRIGFRGDMYRHIGGTSMDVFLAQTGLFTLDEIEAIVTALAIPSFNVPYVMHKTNGELLTVEQENSWYTGQKSYIYMSRLRREVRELFDLLQPDMIYIGLGDVNLNELGNLIFFMGDRIYFASDIVAALFGVNEANTIDQGRMIQYEIGIEDTIVDAINSKDAEINKEDIRISAIQYGCKNISLRSSFRPNNINYLA